MGANERIYWPTTRWDSKSNVSDEEENRLRDILHEFAFSLEQYCFHEKLNLYMFPIFKRFDLICYITSKTITYLFSENVSKVRLIVFAKLKDNRSDLTAKELEEKVNLTFGFELFKRERWTNPFKIVLPISIMDSGNTDRFITYNEIAKAITKSKRLPTNDSSTQIIIHPIFYGRNFSLDEHLCFILMPFKEPFNRIYRDNIIPVVRSCNLNPLRADDIFTSSSIVEDIWELINRAKLIISDVSGKNPNVFYELGIAHTIGKDVIIITQNEDDIPFDLRHIRYFLYVDNENGWNKLKDDLQKAIKSTLDKRK